MAVTGIKQFMSEDQFIDSCIDAMQSPDPVRRVHARLARDILPVMQRELSDSGADPSDLVSATIRLFATQTVMLAIGFAKPGNEIEMIGVLLDAVRSDAIEAMKLQATGAETIAGPAAKRAGSVADAERASKASLEGDQPCR